ncbi:unnamed protein product [Linum trigynum]|uniref:Uncharacterized protein n=1 Tax=Linum trigynum TaxID=586398 RepID=A0AAV2E427_9ROSI
MNIPSLLHGLGWNSLVEDTRFSYCPESVRKFYVNIKCGPGCNPSFFTTTVFDYEVKVTPQLLANLLDLPYSGFLAGTDGEFSDRGFCFSAELASLTRDIGRFYPTQLAAGCLHEDLKILSNARFGRQISYASLMFHHMIKYGMEYFTGLLPFGPQITKLLYKVGIDLSENIILCNVLEDLRPQHILAKLDAEVGPRKLVTGSGGVNANPAESYVSGKLVGALMDASISVVKRESVMPEKPTTSLKRLREKDLMWPKFIYESGTVNDAISSDSESEEAEGVSDYESPPDYPF